MAFFQCSKIQCLKNSIFDNSNSITISHFSHSSFFHQRILEICFRMSIKAEMFCLHMKRAFSTVNVGIIVTVIVLGLIVIDYRLLRRDGVLKSSNLRSMDRRNKVYDVDTMDIVLSKLDTMAKKIERLSNVVESRIPKTASASLNRKPSKEKPKPASNMMMPRSSFDTPFKKPETMKLDILPIKSSEDKLNKPIIKADIQKGIKKDPSKDNGNPDNPLKELFSLTKIIRNFEKERNERKEKEEAVNNRISPTEQSSPIFTKSGNSSDKEMKNKDDVLNLVRSKFADAVDLSIKPSNKDNQDEGSKYKPVEAPLFFHRIGDLGNSPFDNIPNLTDFTGSISSTLITSKEIPSDDSKEVKSKVTSKVKVDIESSSPPENEPPSKDLSDNRVSLGQIMKSAKIEDPSKEKIDNKPKKVTGIKDKEPKIKIGSKDRELNKMSVNSEKESKIKIGSNDKESRTMPVMSDREPRTNSGSNDKEQYQSKQGRSSTSRTERVSPLEKIKKKHIPYAETNKNNKTSPFSVDNFNQRAIEDLLPSKTEDSLQIEQDRKIEQEHLQRDKEKRDNPLLSDFDLLEKEINMKKQIKNAQLPASLSFQPLSSPEISKSKTTVKKDNNSKRRFKEEKSRLEESKKKEESPSKPLSSSKKVKGNGPLTSKGDSPSFLGISLTKKKASTAEPEEDTEKSKKETISSPFSFNKTSLLADKEDKSSGNDKLNSSEASETSSTSKSENSLKSLEEENLLENTNNL